MFSRETIDLISSNSEKSISIIAFDLKFKVSESGIVISKSLLILYVLFKLLPRILELILIFSDNTSTCAIKSLLLIKEFKSIVKSLSSLRIKIVDSIEDNCFFVPEILEFILREFKFNMSRILSSEAIVEFRTKL